MAGGDGFWQVLDDEVVTEAEVRDAGRWEVLLDESEQPVSTGAGDWLYVWVGGT